MKIAQLSYSLSSSSAPTRLNRALRENNCHSDLYARESSDQAVYILKKPSKAKTYFNILQTHLLNQYFKVNDQNYNNLPFTNNLLAPGISSIIDTSNFDLLHLHWISDSLINLSSLQRINKPIVWTFHDVWPLTGGCHCNLGCEKWRNGCGECPQLNSTKALDVSSFWWKRKLKSLRGIKNLTVISPSNWLGNMVSESPLFEGVDLQIIPNCLDTDIFHPLDKSFARATLNLPQDIKIILFGATGSVTTSYKGFDLLIDALKIIKQKTPEKFHLLVFGAVSSDIKDLELPYPTTFLGNLNDELSISIVYNCADVFVGPSRQDNLPNTFLEASACGKPTVGFSTGGIPEITIHKKNGYIANQFDTTDLADGILWVLKDMNRQSELGKFAREKAVRDYSKFTVAQKHIELYRKILSRHHS
jgi:glycosyltransferase involved in cell wall biosynthesis